LTKENGNVSIYEYEKGEWTFHAKGLWITEHGETTPSLSVVGSSNFSKRSNRRDTES